MMTKCSLFTCEDDYFFPNGGEVNIYVGHPSKQSNPNPSNLCKKRSECECEQPEKPKRVKCPPPPEPVQCPEQFPEAEDGDMLRLLRNNQTNLLFSEIGFPETGLGEATFEEMIQAEEPSAFLPSSECGNIKDVIESNNAYEDEVEQWFTTEDPTEEPPTEPPLTLTRSAPTYTAVAYDDGATMINSQTAISQAVPSVTSQDPDGIGWISQANWDATYWDGVPFDVSAYLADPSQTNLAEICDFIRPVSGNGYVIKGLRQHFYNINPFSDNANPTPSEIAAWNIEVIRHFRALLGNPTPIEGDARLYLECRWAFERSHTQYWDSKYPDTVTCGQASDESCLGKAPGPCFDNGGNKVDLSAGHCGDAFFPDVSDRAPYIAAAPYNNDTTTYPELEGYNSRASLTGGNNGANADLPWSIKLAFIISGWICTEGLSGHPGPYVGFGGDARTKFGCAWWWSVDNLSGNGVSYKAKWI